MCLEYSKRLLVRIFQVCKCILLKKLCGKRFEKIFFFMKNKKFANLAKAIKMIVKRTWNGGNLKVSSIVYFLIRDIFISCNRMLNAINQTTWPVDNSIIFYLHFSLRFANYRTYTIYMTAFCLAWKHLKHFSYTVFSDTSQIVPHRICRILIARHDIHNVVVVYHFTFFLALATRGIKWQ